MGLWVWRVSCFFVLVTVIICTLRGPSHESRNKTMEVLLADRVLSWEMDDNTAELLWNNCGLDLIHVKRAIKYPELCIPGEIACGTNDFIPESLSIKERMQELMTSRHPQMKQTLLECLVRKNLMLRSTGEEDDPSIFYTKFLESMFTRFDVPRRSLQSAVGSPTSSPEPSPSSAPSKSPASPFFPPVSASPPSPPPRNSIISPTPGSNVQSNNKHNSRSIAIAVGVTASVTFVVSTLIFLCYMKVKNRSKVRRNDERPFVRLNKNGLSDGSSHNSCDSGLSVNEEKHNNGSVNKLKVSNASFNIVSGHHGKISSFDETVHVESHFINASNHSSSVGPISAAIAAASTKYAAGFNNIQNPPLKPPPGRAGRPPPIPPSLNPFPGVAGNRPLAPPPGRIIANLPPVPPSGRAPPHATPAPNSANPAPPPPPVPSASVESVSAGPPPPPPPKPLPGKPGPPPKPLAGKPGPPPPPPIPLAGKPGPPPPPRSGLAPPRPPLVKNASTSNHADSFEDEADAPKAKLKPFFWDKVLANPDHSMVWHQIKSGSFQFNEEMIETLFGYPPPDKANNEKKNVSTSKEPAVQYIQILDAKRAQNLSILLRALNITTEEVCDALKEGNELPSEFVETLLKMAPTVEEELKLRLFTGEVSQLGPAERFLKALVDTPFSFKRLETLLFMSSLQEEVSLCKESFGTLEVACKELRNSRLFLKLLEAVLKTGNRMNNGTFRGGAQAFKLDTLLKLSDVKGVDGKTTLLHFVVQEIIRSEGVRAARAAKENRSLSSVKSDDDLEGSLHESEDYYRDRGLQVVSGLGSELQNVKKAADVDADNLKGTVAKLSHRLNRSKDFLNTDMRNLGEESGFHEILKSFVQNAEIDVKWLMEEERRIMTLVKSTGDYFHGNAGKDEGLRLFVIVRDFMIMLDKVCKEVGNVPARKPSQTPKKSASSGQPSESPQSPDMRQRLFPAITDRRNYSSSDEEN